MSCQELILEFQKAIKDDYGKDVSLEEASSILTDLVDYFNVLAKIQHKRLIEREVI